MRKNKIKIFFFIFFTLFFFSSFAQEIRWLKVYNFKGDVGISYESLEESSEQNNELTYDYNENFLKYSVGLGFHGYVYHPYFVDFIVDSTLILNDAKTSIFTDSVAYADFNNRYNINIWVLKRKPLNFLIYLKNNEATYPRLNYGRYFSYTQTNGVKVKSNFKYLPFTLDVYHSSIISQSLFSFDRRESSNNIKFESDIIDTNNNNLTLRAFYKNHNESVFDTHYISFNSMLTWNKSFPNKEDGIINANLDFRSIEGDSYLKTFSGSITYHKPLAKSLDGYASASFSSSDNNAYKRELSVLNFGLRHQLYLSLTSSVNFSFQNEVGDLNRIKRNMANFNVFYKKRIPTGSVSLSFLHFLQDITNKSKGDYTLQELYASFESSDTITISQTGIDPASIVVMSSDGTHVYVEGVDYKLVISDTMVVVVRLFGGQIDEGQTVLIVYNVKQFPDYKTNIHQYENNFSLNFFKYLFVGAKIRKSSNTVDSDFIITPYEEYTLRERHFGLKSNIFYYQRSRSKYYGTFSEYNMKSENFRVGYRVGRYTAGYYFLKYNLDFLSTDYFSYFKNSSIFFSGVLFGKLTYQFDYRKLSYNQSNFLRDRKSIVCRLNATIRKLRFEFFYEYILDKGDIADRKHDYFRFTVRRFF